MNISADMARVGELGKKMQERASEYQTQVNKIYSEVDELESAWKGKDNTDYVNKVREHRADIETLGKIIESYGAFLNEVSVKMTNLQNDIASAAGQL